MSNDSELAVEAIQQTLTAFRSQCEDWGREFNSLLDELEMLPAPGAVSAAELDQMIDKLTNHQQHLAQRQDDIGDELAAVHSIVERQVEMLDTLLSANSSRQPTVTE